MTKRHQLLKMVATHIRRLPLERIVRVGVDGVDGAGKTVFADELAELLIVSKRPVIRASVDGFHNPRPVRYAKGRTSPAGYFADSFNYPALKAILLDPLSPGGSRRYRVAAFDHRSDMPVSGAEHEAARDSILVFDGIFLHRPELRDYWDCSIFLRVGFDASIPRCAVRDGCSPDPEAAGHRRYVNGQMLYLLSCEPAARATLTIDNCDLAAPFILQRSN